MCELLHFSTNSVHMWLHKLCQANGDVVFLFPNRHIKRMIWAYIEPGKLEYGIIVYWHLLGCRIHVDIVTGNAWVLVCVRLTICGPFSILQLWENTSAHRCLIYFNFHFSKACDCSRMQNPLTRTCSACHLIGRGYIWQVVATHCWS